MGRPGCRWADRALRWCRWRRARRGRMGWWFPGRGWLRMSMRTLASKWGRWIWWLRRSRRRGGRWWCRRWRGCSAMWTTAAMWIWTMGCWWPCTGWIPPCRFPTTALLGWAMSIATVASSGQTRRCWPPMWSIRPIRRSRRYGLASGVGTRSTRLRRRCGGQSSARRNKTPPWRGCSTRCRCSYRGCSRSTDAITSTSASTATTTNATAANISTTR